MYTAKTAARNIPLIQYGFAMKCTLLSAAALAGSPPSMQGDGNGGISFVPPYHRLKCTDVEVSTGTSYPKGFGPKKSNKQAQQPGGPGDPKPGIVYVEVPVIPGAQVKKTAVSGGKFNYCVQPFLVNTGASTSPPNITVYLTRNPESNQYAAGVDTALVTTQFGGTPRSAKVVQAIPAGATKVIPEIWCATLSESEAKGLSLFANVPAQSLIMPDPRSDASTKTASTTAGASTQKVGVAQLSQKPTVRIPTSIQEYSTVCKLEFPDPEAPPVTSASPQPRVLANNQDFGIKVAPLLAYLTRTIPTTGGSGAQPSTQSTSQ